MLQLSGNLEGKLLGHASLKKFSLGYTGTSTFSQEETQLLSQQKKLLIEILFSGVQTTAFVSGYVRADTAKYSEELNHIIFLCDQDNLY